MGRRISGTKTLPRRLMWHAQDATRIEWIRCMPERGSKRAGRTRKFTELRGRDGGTPHAVPPGMKQAAKALATYAAVLGLGLLATEDVEADDGCTLTLYVINGFDTNIRTAKGELGSPKHWQTAWESEDVIEPQKSVRKIIPTGQSCTDANGSPRRWNARVTRKNGKRHMCSGISRSSKATLKAGGGCEVSRKDGT